MHKSSQSPVSYLDTSNNAGVSAVNVADAVSSITATGGETPRISRCEYYQKMNTLMTKQPTKIGQKLGGENLISYRQQMYDVLKARHPTIYTRDGPSKMLMSTSNSAPNANNSDSNDSDEADSEAPLSSPNTVNQIHCRWHLRTQAYSATNADDLVSNDSDGSENDDTLSMMDIHAHCATTRVTRKTNVRRGKRLVSV